MTSVKVDWKALFLEARKLLKDEADQHANSCGCRDVGDTVVEGPCPGVEEMEEFLKKTAKHVPQDPRQSGHR